MCDHIADELLIKCGENVVDLAIGNVKTGGLPFAAIVVNSIIYGLTSISLPTSFMNSRL